MRLKLIVGSIMLLIVVAAGLRAMEGASPRLARRAIAESRIAQGANISLRELTRQSELIVVGQCTEVRSEWTDPRTLATLATVSVGEALKGATGAAVMVVIPGGVDATRRIPVAVTVPGAPTLLEGEEVLLFLTEDPSIPNGYAVTGLADGKFSVTRNEQGAFVSRDPIGLSGREAKRAPATSQMVPLGEFTSQVRRYLR